MPLNESANSLFAWLIVAIQLGGLLSATAARRSMGSSAEAWCQRLFFAALAAVGVTAMLTLLVWPGAVLASGATLAVMVLAVVWDFGTGAVNKAK